MLLRLQLAALFIVFALLIWVTFDYIYHNDDYDEPDDWDILP